jgi:hypothetical protein
MASEYKELVFMSKAFISSVLQDSAELTGGLATRVAGDVMDAIVRELKKEGKVTAQVVARSNYRGWGVGPVRRRWVGTKILVDVTPASRFEGVGGPFRP